MLWILLLVFVVQHSTSEVVVVPQYCHRNTRQCHNDGSRSSLSSRRNWGVANQIISSSANVIVRFRGGDDGSSVRNAPKAEESREKKNEKAMDVDEAVSSAEGSEVQNVEKGGENGEEEGSEREGGVEVGEAEEMGKDVGQGEGEGLEEVEGEKLTGVKEGEELTEVETEEVSGVEVGKVLKEAGEEEDLQEAEAEEAKLEEVEEEEESLEVVEEAEEKLAEETEVEEVEKKEEELIKVRKIEREEVEEGGKQDNANKGSEKDQTVLDTPQTHASEFQEPEKKVPEKHVVKPVLAVEDDTSQSVTVETTSVEGSEEKCSAVNETDASGISMPVSAAARVIAPGGGTDKEETEEITEVVTAESPTGSSQETNENENIHPAVETIDERMRQILKQLNYHPSEVRHMQPSIAAVVVNKRLRRPNEGIPPHWYVDDKTSATKKKSNELINRKNRILNRKLIITLSMGMISWYGVRSIDLGCFISDTCKLEKQDDDESTVVGSVVEDPSIDAEDIPLPAHNDNIASTKKDDFHPHSIKPNEEKPPPKQQLDETWLDKGITAIENRIKALFNWKF